MAEQTIQTGMVASLAYRLMVEDEVIEDVNADEAVDYLHGEENLVPGLERALAGKKAGDKFSLTLQPDEGYGEYDDELVEEMPREELDEDEELKPGMEIELLDEDGDVFEATVREVRDDVVVMDFNPPLAGKVLNYDVEVVAVRPATEDELEMGFPASLLDELYDQIADEGE